MLIKSGSVGLFHNLQLFLGSALLALLLLVNGCAPAAKKEPTRLERVPVALVSQAQSGNSDGSVELALEDRLGDAGRSERVQIVLPRDLRLMPAMDAEDLGLTVEYKAYLQDGVSKHGDRNYSDGILPILLRFRPFCLIRYRPFLTEDEHARARAKVMTSIASERLKNTDLMRIIPRGEKLVFAVDRASERFDPRTRLLSMELYPVQQDAQSPQYITRMKCVGPQNSTRLLRESFGVRSVFSLDLL